MVIDGERGGMDAELGGGAGSDKKRSWSGTNHPDPARDCDPDAGRGAGRNEEPPSRPVAAPTPDDDVAVPRADDVPARIQAPPPVARPEPTASLATEEPVGASSLPDGPAGRPSGGGISGLPLPYQVVAAIALAVMGVLACGHIAMIFLHVAPSNTLTKQHGRVVDDWVYPEFEQNWKLFAPNPLQQNISVQVRAEVAGADGPATTRWIDLSQEDGAAIRGNVLPSHVDQNELRRAWDFFTGSHDSENRSNGLRGDLSERYIRRIVMLRLADHDLPGKVERIQVRSAVRSLGAPSWSDEKISTDPSYRVLPWWIVTPSDLPGTHTTEKITRDGRAKR
ncbi:DUF5819 family protein [Streptomyces sp. NPDC057428]|uniref:DUF5819 family protein n=1 Tax=Streptomyces sp. NPDC057428 TaxID=3346129 RepID=UPI0036930347